MKCDPMKIVCSILVILCLTIEIKAQFNETVRTDRPGQAIGPFAVGKHVFQSQTGVDIGGINDSPNNSSNQYLTPNTILRFGVTRYFELNTAFEYRYVNHTVADSNYVNAGLSGVIVGTRINLYDGNGQSPSVGIQVGFRLPVLSQPFNPDYVAPVFLLIASDNLSDRVALLANLGIGYNGVNAKPNGQYVLNLSYSISPSWGTYIETFGSFSNTNFVNSWDTGLAYLVNKNLQLDIYGGAGFTNRRLSYLVSLGISWRTLAFRDNSLNQSR